MGLRLGDDPHDCEAQAGFEAHEERSARFGPARSVRLDLCAEVDLQTSVLSARDPILLGRRSPDQVEGCVRRLLLVQDLPQQCIIGKRE